MELSPRLGLGTINIASFVEGLIYYQSMYLEFRYGDGRVLGTQPYSTCGSASTHCVLCLNLIKGIFTTCILDSHTHTNIHLSNMAFSSQTLAYIYHTSHYIISKVEIQTWQQSNMGYRHLNIKNSSFNQACLHLSLKAYSKQMHVHMNA